MLGRLGHRIGLAGAAFALTTAATVLGAPPASAAIYYDDVYLTVACNYGYYGSTTYVNYSTQIYATYYGSNHWQLRLDSNVGILQYPTFRGYCNGMYGQPQYYKGQITIGVAAASGLVYYRTI